MPGRPEATQTKGMVCCSVVSRIITRCTRLLSAESSNYDLEFRWGWGFRWGAN